MSDPKPSVIKSLPRTFWIANTMELFERWAWYGMYAIFAIYLTDPVSQGGLGFSDAQRGSITGIIPFVLYLLPIFTGALSDHFGYKRTLISAYCILIGGYFLMGHVTTYYPMFFAFLMVAVGAAMFKPVLSATISHTTNEGNASIGFGIFYAMVNIGGFVGPWLGGVLRKISWDYVFYMSMGAITLNLLLVCFFYKEPTKQDGPKKSILTVFKEIGLVFSDLKFVLFLVLLSGFWTAFNQIFITLPLTLRDWVDTSVIWCWFSGFSSSAKAACDAGEMFNPEWIVNIDAGAIILLQILVSTVVMRFKPISTIVAGILISAIGIGSLALGHSMPLIIAGIVIFAIGEMTASPKSTEYIGSIAPEDRKALYMGYSFIPVALGNLFAGLLSGSIYGAMGNKKLLAGRFLQEKFQMAAESLKDLDQEQIWNLVMQKTGASSLDAMNQVYEAYNPGNMWYIFGAIGVFAALALFLYNLKFGKTSEQQAQA